MKKEKARLLLWLCVPELMLLATDAGGGALALNALLNLHALDYSDSVLVVAYVAEACPLLGGAAAQLSVTCHS